MMLIEIDSDKCLRDGHCLKICPIGLLKQDPEGYPCLPEEKERLCIGCGHCLAVCPAGALSQGGHRPEALPGLRPELAITPEQAAQFLGSRRSVRFFQDKPVARETLVDLANLAALAPSAMNLQPLRWIMIEGREKVASLLPLVVDWMRESGVYPGMVRAFERGLDLILREAPVLVAASCPAAHPWPEVDCAIALCYFELAALSRGLGGCWAGLFSTVRPCARSWNCQRIIFWSAP